MSAVTKLSNKSKYDIRDIGNLKISTKFW